MGEVQAIDMECLCVRVTVDNLSLLTKCICDLIRQSGDIEPLHRVNARHLKMEARIGNSSATTRNDGAKGIKAFPRYDTSVTGVV
jgi:hypothetical protein